MNAVEVSLAEVEPPSWLAEYRSTCRNVLDEAGLHQVELSVVLMDGDGIRRLNREFRNVDAETDVLSFSQREDRGQETTIGAPRRGGPEAIGDVVVCPSVVEAHAADLGIPFREELHRVTIHGILHLLGMNHDSGATMLDYQEELLKRVNQEGMDR